MSKLLVIIGATGQQGGSIINTVVEDAELSKMYKVRGITRDPSSPAAQALQAKGVEVVAGSIDEPSTLAAAFKGANTIFAMTVTAFDAQAKTREVHQGHSIADAAVASGATYLIFSSLAHIGDTVSPRKLHSDIFDSKAEIEAYIRTLPIKSAFFAPGSFMQNYHAAQAPRPSPANDGTYAIANFISPSALIPHIDAADDSGKYVGAILAEPEKFEGKVLHAATGMYSYAQIAEIMSKESGKTVRYMQVPKEVYQGFMPPGPMAEQMVDMFTFIEDYGYFGPGTDEKVKWTAGVARGNLTTFEEYLTKHPLKFQ